MNKIKIILSTFIIIYLVLLIPECENAELNIAEGKHFVWNSDSLWNELERRFSDARTKECDSLSVDISSSLDLLRLKINQIKEQPYIASDPIFIDILNLIFHTAPLIGACPDHSVQFFDLISQMREAVKKQSIDWDFDQLLVRNQLYRLIYGARATVEEIMLQTDNDSLFTQIVIMKEPSVTPSTNFMGIEIHSGDILVSRGGAPTSALISRGSDYPGNFSHIALVYVDPETNIPSIIESHIEIGVAVSSLENYINDKKLRIMVLRLRSDLPIIKSDPMIPHKAAAKSLARVRNDHIPYDFEMDYKNDDKLFCSEVASTEYRKLGIELWKGESTISSKGTAEILAGFGVENFVTQEPSDLEYDPKVSVVAEWRDPETLYKDHVDNAVVDAILEWKEKGNDIEINYYLLPIYKFVKLYSTILNQVNLVGPIPEGMSATSALRHEGFNSLHDDIKSYVLTKAEEFKSEKNYTAPYWWLVRFADAYFESVD